LLNSAEEKRTFKRLTRLFKSFYGSGIFLCFRFQTKHKQMFPTLLPLRTSIYQGGSASKI